MPSKPLLPMPPTVVIRKKRPASSSTTSSSPSVVSSPVPPRTLPARSQPPPAAVVVPATLSQTTDSPSPPDQPSRKQRDAQARAELLRVLQERWPQMFPRDWRAVKPFAVGIHQDILHELPTVKPYLLRRTIRFYQQGGKGAYWRTLLKGGFRYHLDGTLEGEITAQDQAHAREELAAVAAWWQAKRAQRSAHARTEQLPPLPPPTPEVSERS